MTTTIKSEYFKNNKIKISIRQENTLYIVIDSTIDDICEYPITKNTYNTIKKAKKRYSTLKTKYNK